MKIGVVGLGLIGGSIYKKLSQLCYEVVGISKSQNGKEHNITDNIEALKDCEIIFVATPINSTIAKLKELEKVVNKNTIVADCCSLKEFLTKDKYNFKFIPSHPMAGTEFQGYENSFAELFNGAKWVLTPIDETSTDSLEKIIKELGATPVITSPREHDEAVALISHMPMVIAQGLMESIKDNQLAKILASSGFRDMTRLALSNTEMAEDMVKYNHKNIESSLHKLYNSVDNLLNDYHQNINRIKEVRNKMYSKDGKNII